MGKLQPGTVVEFTYYGKVYNGKVEEWDIVCHEYTVKYYIDGKLCRIGRKRRNLTLISEPEDESMGEDSRCGKCFMPLFYDIHMNCPGCGIRYGFPELRGRDNRIDYDDSKFNEDEFNEIVISKNMKTNISDRYKIAKYIDVESAAQKVFGICDMRAEILKYKTAAYHRNKDAAIIIFRNFVRFTIKRRFICFIQEFSDALIDEDHNVNMIDIYATDVYADDQIVEWHSSINYVFSNEFLNDTRNLLIDFDLYEFMEGTNTEEFAGYLANGLTTIDMTENIRFARNTYNQRRPPV